MAEQIREGSVSIKSFNGIDQTRDDYGSDLGTSPNAVNFICHHGFLRTFKGVHELYPTLPSSCTRMFQTFFRDANNNDLTYLVACGNNSVYYYNGASWITLGSGFSSNDWDGVNYRHESTDWFIMTNGNQCMKYWDAGSSLHDVIPQQGDQPIKFEHLTLIYERLWGAVRADQPDRVYWSKSFAPGDWQPDYETPDDGGGFVDVATFDGSRIRAIVAAFDDVLIFKDRSMHRLNGTYPGDFNLTQVYGSEGTIASRTIVHTADKLYFLGSDGLCIYDGMTVSTLAHTGDRKIKRIFERINKTYISKSCAVIDDDVMYLAVPLDTSSVNSHVIIYNLSDGTYSLVAIDGITEWLLWRDGSTQTLLCLIGNHIYQFDSGTSLPSNGLINASWISPIINLGSFSSKKSTGRIYASVTTQSLDVTRKPQIKLTMLSEKKSRTKVLDLENGSNLIRKRVKIRGRWFRFKIENVSGNPLTINKGLEIVYEEDTD